MLNSTALWDRAPALYIDNIRINVNWEHNQSVKEIFDYVQNETIVLTTSYYGGFEQVGTLPRSFSRADKYMKTQQGDIVLYSGNQLVIFFGSNSYNYTKLGHINLPANTLKNMLDVKSTVVKISRE